jgi:Acyl-CoA carboxylase epsilon subunit
LLAALCAEHANSVCRVRTSLASELTEKEAEVVTLAEIADPAVIRVTRGDATPEELSALTVVLLALAHMFESSYESAARRSRAIARWRHPDWNLGRVAHSWRAAA